MPIPMPAQSTRPRRALQASVKPLNDLAVHRHATDSSLEYWRKHWPFLAAVIYYTIAGALRAAVAINARRGPGDVAR